MAQQRGAASRTLKVPGAMKAAAIERFGPPGVLELRTIPVPDPGPNEVLIALHSAGVGGWDAGIRQGTWAGGGERFPMVLGTDGAGIVAAKGSRVRNFRIGDRVWAYEYDNPKGGFYAEYVAVNAGSVGRVPDSLDLLQAGAGAATGLTALRGIDSVLRLRRKETALIFGATGAVGTLAVQFAKRRGARVLATATGRPAAALVLKLGSDAAIDSRSSDAVERVRTLAPEGIDAVLALAGGDALEGFIDLVRDGGRVAFPNGVEPEPRRRRGIRFQSYDAVADPSEFDRLRLAAVEAGLRVPIAAIFPLAQAARAHERLERGHILGRIVLRIRGRDKRV